jgi:hypothetical protein
LPTLEEYSGEIPFFPEKPGSPHVPSVGVVRHRAAGEGRSGEKLKNVMNFRRRPEKRDSAIVA